MANRTTVAFRGHDDIRYNLRELPSGVRAEVLKDILERASVPIIREMRSKAPRRTGALQKSLAVKGIAYKTTGDAKALIGPDRNYYKAGAKVKKGGDRRGADKPSNYAHLVEFGHLTSLKSANSKRLYKYSARESAQLALRGDGAFIGKGRLGKSFVEPQPFLRPGFAAGLPKAQDIIARDVTKSLERVRAKRIKAGTHIV